MKYRKYIMLGIGSIIMASCGGPKKTTSHEETQKKHPEWSYNAVMYELNIRQFTEEGTFAAAEKHLPRLKELGVDIIWLMPIYPIGEMERKGELGSYYAISDYKGINPEFGTMDDFKSFVDNAHSMGFKVIIDWVANHTSPDALWAVNLDWYVLNNDGSFMVQYDWTDIAKLNYENNEMRAAMIDAMTYWLRETKIDGFRCDVAYEVPTDFWNEAIDSLTAVNPEIFMLAEAEKPELNKKCFDSYYFWEMHHLMNGIAKGEKNAEMIWKFLKRNNNRFPKNSIPLLFTSNHDENSWNGTESERLGEGAKTFAALTYLLPGMPLIYNGQEVGMDKRLEFFKKDTINWTDKGGFTQMYTDLNKLRKENKALWSAQAGGTIERIKNDASDKILTLVRETEGNTIFAAFNFSSKTISADIKMDKYAAEYTDALNGETVELNKSCTLILKPWEYRIYKRD